MRTDHGPPIALRSPPGLCWPAREGSARDLPLVLWHGFAGRAESWKALVAHLEGRPAWAFDLPGHGPNPLPVPEAEDPFPVTPLFEALDAAGIERAVLCGYSLGGRLALRAALHEPRRCAGLVTIGAHPGLPDARRRAERREADERWAVLIERQGIDVFAERWAGLDVFASQKDLPPAVRTAQQALRRSHRPEALAAAMRRWSLGRMPDCRPRLASLACPALCLAGERDSKFAPLARELASAMLDGRFALVPGTGHNPVLEDPARTARLIDAFWKEIRR